MKIIIDEEDKEILFGYFLSFHRLTEEEKKDYKFSGQLEFRRRKEKREQELFQKNIEKIIKKKIK